MNNNDVLIFDSRQTLSLNAIGQVSIRQDWSTPRRTIPDYEIVIVASGQLVFDVDGQRLLLREGEAVLLPPCLVHEAPAGQRASVYFFHFNAPDIPPPVSIAMARRRLARSRKAARHQASSHILPEVRLSEIMLTRRLQLGPMAQGHPQPLANGAQG